MGNLDKVNTGEGPNKNEKTGIVSGLREKVKKTAKAGVIIASAATATQALANDVIEQCDINGDHRIYGRKEAIQNQIPMDIARKEYSCKTKMEIDKLIAENQELTRRDQELTRRDQELTRRDQELTRRDQELTVELKEATEKNEKATEKLYNEVLRIASSGQ